MVIIKKKKNEKKYIVILAIIALVMIVSACLIINLIMKNRTPKQDSNSIVVQNNVKQEKTENDENTNDEEIKTLSESNRMKRYMGNFFNDIEEGEYQKAYNTLNTEFKNNYFSNIEEFKQYVDKNFKNNMLGVTYDNIERWGNNKTGNMYVIWITVADVMNGKKETNFVIIENDYNDYEMSFSVNIEE